VKKFWLVKQEPSAYSWTNFVADGKTAWTGVRNYTARNNLRAMRKGDLLFFYHSVTDKSVVGEAEVVREWYPDPTAEEGDWACVDLKPVRAFAQPVPLERIVKDREIDAGMALLRSGFCVSPVSPEEFAAIVNCPRADFYWRAFKTATNLFDDQISARRSGFEFLSDIFRRSCRSRRFRQALRRRAGNRSRGGV
jgi:predicted RNA-binding protein with PUA-like domain